MTTGDLVPALVAAGPGLGAVIAPLADIVLAGVPHRDAGSASGVFNTGLQVGNSIGVVTGVAETPGAAAPFAVNSFLAGPGSINAQSAAARKRDLAGGVTVAQRFAPPAGPVPALPLAGGRGYWLVGVSAQTSTYHSATGIRKASWPDGSPSGHPGPPWYTRRPTPSPPPTPPWIRCARPAAGSCWTASSAGQSRMWCADVRRETRTGRCPG